MKYSPRQRASILLLTAAATAIASCAAEPVGELLVIAADQTVENPIRDVLEVVVGSESFYPGLAAGGLPFHATDWLPGDQVEIVFWPNAEEEPTIRVTLSIPGDYSPGGQLTLVAEVEDDYVRVFNSVLGISEVHARTNPAEIQRGEEAAAAELEALAAEREAADAEAAETEKLREAADLAFEIKREAAVLGFDMEAVSGDLDEVLEEDRKVYGEDGTARLTAVAKKYESYTTEALDDLRDELPSRSYQTDRVAELNSRWVEWWDDFVAVHRDRWIAADNGDTVSLTRINERVSALWDEWAEMFDRVAELQEISASDL